MTYSTVNFAVTDGIARLTLNRPERLSSFNAEMHGEGPRRAVARRVAAVRARALLGGAGRGFCAGQDLSDRAVAQEARRRPRRSIELRYKPLVLAPLAAHAR